MLKNREGEEQDFVTNFNFYPVDFSETTYPADGAQQPVTSEWDDPSS
jgi:hypothetical protein